MPGLPSAIRAFRARAGRGEPPPLPPPEVPPEQADLYNRAPVDDGFLSGNGIAWRCGWIRNYGPPIRNEAGRSDWYFCKTDYVDWFFAHEAPTTPFVLVSHNSDIAVDDRLARHLRRRRLRGWLAANVAVRHPKLRPLPLGIANPRWPHGDVDALAHVQRKPPPKHRLFDVSFSLETNETVRSYCLDQTALELQPPLPFPAYLERLASSWFSICPRGNGLDTHRIWEALYVGTVPVVVRSPLTDAYPELPLVVLDDWRQFSSIDFTPALYERLWSEWDPAFLRLDRFLDRIGAGLGCTTIAPARAR